MWQKLAKRLKCRIDKALVDEKRKADMAIEVKSEAKELRKQVRGLQQQLNAACDRDSDARLHCQQLVTLHGCFTHHKQYLFHES